MYIRLSSIRIVLFLHHLTIINWIIIEYLIEVEKKLFWMTIFSSRMFIYFAEYLYLNMKLNNQTSYSVNIYFIIPNPMKGQALNLGYPEGVRQKYLHCWNSCDASQSDCLNNPRNYTYGNSNKIKQSVIWTGLNINILIHQFIIIIINYSLVIVLFSFQFNFKYN